MTQWPVFGSTRVSVFVATSLTCLPSASPFAFSPPMASTGMVSLVWASIYFEHFWNDFAADGTKSIPEADRVAYTIAYARPGRMRASATINPMSWPTTAAFWMPSPFTRS